MITRRHLSGCLPKSVTLCRRLVMMVMLSCILSSYSFADEVQCLQQAPEELLQLHDQSYLGVVPQAVGSPGRATKIDPSDSLPLWLQAIYWSNQELRAYLPYQLELLNNQLQDAKQDRPLAVYEAKIGKAAFLVQKRGSYMCAPNVFVMATSNGHAVGSTLAGCLQNEPMVFQESSNLLVAFVDSLTFDSAGPLAGVAYEKSITLERMSWDAEQNQNSKLSITKPDWCRIKLQGVGSVHADLLEGALQLSDIEAAGLWMAVLLIGAPGLDDLGIQTTAPTSVEPSSEGIWKKWGRSAFPLYRTIAPPHHRHIGARMT
jgi:hypothetical protein